MGIPQTDKNNILNISMSVSDTPFTILRPSRQSAPVVYTSPHSGNHYPKEFVENSRLDALSLRRSEDAFVDELYESCIKFGSPLLKANFPRAYVDPNREPYELDPDMFEHSLPSYVNTDSPRALAGLGTIAKVVSNGKNIYKHKLKFEEIRTRIENLYHPYHAALRQLIEETRNDFGACLLIDCHSMPSAEGMGIKGNASHQTDIVLGDRFGTACADWITDLAHEAMVEEGFKVRRNRPYAGGFTTQHYGDPANRVHTLQIELNRNLYMNEENVSRLPELKDIKRRLQNVIERFNAIKPTEL